MEIDMMTNAFVHLVVDYMRGKVDATFAELSSVITSVLKRVAMIQSNKKTPMSRKYFFIKCHFTMYIL